MGDPINYKDLPFHLKGQLSLVHKQLMDGFNRALVDKLVKSTEGEPVNIPKKSISSTVRWSRAQVVFEMDEDNAKEYDIYNDDDLGKVIEERISSVSDELTDSDVSGTPWSGLKR